MSNNVAIMGKHRNGWLSNLLGVIALLLMMVAAVGLLYFY
jgi:Mn2+/Fe2+ NRAMP family transporter